MIDNPFFSEFMIDNPFFPDIFMGFQTVQGVKKIGTASTSLAGGNPADSW